MKIWFVLYAGSQIGGVWGPLPYTSQECQVRAEERNASIAQMISSGIGENGKPIANEALEQIKTWHTACVVSNERPTLSLR